MRRDRHFSALLFCVILVAISVITACSAMNKLQKLANEEVSSVVTLPKGKDYQAPVLNQEVKKDTIKVTNLDGNEIFLMKTVVDSTGEAMAGDVLDAAIVSARFRNIAERNGKVKLAFQLRVPGVFKEQRWQLRFTPVVFVNGDSVKLEKIVITGQVYKELQNYGKYKYGKYREKLARKEGLAKENLEAMNGYMYNRYYMPEPNAVYLDSLVRSDYDEFVYDYVYEFQPSPKLRKVDVYVDGEVRDLKNYIYYMKRSDALTFYISSLSSFAIDDIVRYKTYVISRRVAENMSYNIEFPLGRSDMNPKFRNNAAVIHTIEKQLERLLENKEFDLDSVVVTASASPDGRLDKNAELSQKRSESIARYFDVYMKRKVDSLNRGFEAEYAINAETGRTVQTNEKARKIPFISRNIPEDWDMLDQLVGQDKVMTDEQKAKYHSYKSAEDVDVRELDMRAEPWYKHMSEKLYPQLRAVRFDFSLHRKGMVKDTVHTTVIDSTYIEGVQAIKDRDYETAARLLEPYRDFNAAVALLAINRNYACLGILDELQPNAEIYYMKAIIYARRDEEEKSIQNYVEACKLDRTYISRGNLDPEISSLIKKYSINLLEEEEFN